MIVEQPEVPLDPWTRRVLDHPRVDAGWGLEERDGIHGLSFALNDRLLVRRIELANPAFIETLMGKFGASLVGSLTEGESVWERAEGPPDGEDRSPDRLPPELDVTIWSLPGRAGGSERSVFEVARELWGAFASVDREARSAVQVAPDYLLAPARQWHLCPATDPAILGPQDAVPSTSVIPDFVGRGCDEEILVIDTDFVPHAALGSARIQAEVAPTFQSSTGQWVAYPRTTGITGGPDLRCHGTFVVGCIASRCEASWRFRVVSINELDRSTVDGDGLLPDIATESALARVLIQKLAGSRRFPVVQCGFAGMPADPRDAAARLAEATGGGPHAIPSFIGLTAALAHIETTRGRSMPVIVAPAGNQQSTVPHFPAADPQRHRGGGGLRPLPVGRTTRTRILRQVPTGSTSAQRARTSSASSSRRTAPRASPDGPERRLPRRRSQRSPPASFARAARDSRHGTTF